MFVAKQHPRADVIHPRRLDGNLVYNVWTRGRRDRVRSQIICSPN